MGRCSWRHGDAALALERIEQSMLEVRDRDRQTDRQRGRERERERERVLSCHQRIYLLMCALINKERP